MKYKYKTVYTYDLLLPPPSHCGRCKHDSGSSHCSECNVLKGTSDKTSTWEGVSLMHTNNKLGAVLFVKKKRVRVKATSNN